MYCYYYKFKDEKTEFVTVWIAQFNTQLLKPIGKGGHML